MGISLDFIILLLTSFCFPFIVFFRLASTEILFLICVFHYLSFPQLATPSPSPSNTFLLLHFIHYSNLFLVAFPPFYHIHTLFSNTVVRSFIISSILFSFPSLISRFTITILHAVIFLTFEFHLLVIFVFVLLFNFCFHYTFVLVSML